MKKKKKKNLQNTDNNNNERCMLAGGDRHSIIFEFDRRMMYLPIYYYRYFPTCSIYVFVF